MKTITLIIIAIATAYLSVSFVKAELDFALWGEQARFVAVAVSAIFIAFVPLVLEVLKDKQ